MSNEKEIGDDNNIFSDVEINEGIDELMEVYENDDEDLRTYLSNYSKEDLVEITETLVERHRTADNLLTKLGEEYNKCMERVSQECMTGLYNYEKLEKEIGKNVRRASRRDYVFSLMAMDLDNFDEINNKYGHKMGNDIIKSIGNYLDENTRNYEKAFRQGGDEFAVLLEETETGDALKFTERICKELRQLDVWKNIDKNKVNYGASIGVVSYSNEIDDNNISVEERVEKLYDIADKAMYHSKTSDSFYITSVEFGDSLDDHAFRPYLTEGCERGSKSKIKNYWKLREPGANI